MHRRTLLLALALVLLSHPEAHACTSLDGKPAELPIRSRKPLQGDDVRLTSGFGIRLDPLLNGRRFHYGIDWSAPRGTPVTAANGGRVTVARFENALGNVVVISHGAGWETAYGHLSSFDVKNGDCVEFGTVIGKLGPTGLASGPQLHFEVRRDGKPVDPLSIDITQTSPE